jgi:hypothetical protein
MSKPFECLLSSDVFGVTAGGVDRGLARSQSSRVDRMPEKEYVAKVLRNLRLEMMRCMMVI